MSTFVFQVKAMLFALLVGVFASAYAAEKEQFQFITAPGLPAVNFKESYKPSALYEIIPGTYKIQFGAAGGASPLMKYFVPPGANRFNGRFLMSKSAQPVQGVWRKGLPPSISSTGVTPQMAGAVANNGGDWGDVVIVNTMNGVDQYFYGEPEAGATIISYGSSMPSDAPLQNGEYIYADFTYQFGSAINFDVFWFINKQCYDTWWARTDVWDTLGNPKENMVHTCNPPQESLTVNPVFLTAGSLQLNTAELSMTPSSVVVPAGCSALLTGTTTSASDIVVISGTTVSLAANVETKVATPTAITITCGSYSTNLTVNPQPATLTGIQIGSTSTPVLSADTVNTALAINPLPSNAVLSGSCVSSNSTLVSDPGNTYVVRLNVAAANDLTDDTVVNITCGALPSVAVTVKKKTPVTYTGFTLVPSFLKVGNSTTTSAITAQAGEIIPAGTCSIGSNTLVQLDSATGTIRYLDDKTGISGLTKPATVAVTCGSFTQILTIQPLRYATLEIDTSAVSAPASWSITGLTLGYSAGETTKANEVNSTYKPAIYARLNLTAYDASLHEERYEMIPYTTKGGAIDWIAYRWTTVGWEKIYGALNDRVDPLLQIAKPDSATAEFSIGNSISLPALNAEFINSFKVTKITADLAYYGTGGQVELMQNVWSWDNP